ncbi:sterile alpha motif domain-containing protein 9-like [Osmerus eperlanus]|uniref:sterile alpha motif domain-containing protein 9-like n=1 Tax=Osmerus eperlanus TaxID=29151 RepID=UPI002E125386
MMSHNRKDRVRKHVSQERQSPMASEENAGKPAGQVGAAEHCCPDKHKMEEQPEEKPESPGSPDSIKSEGSLDLLINFNQEGCEELPKREMRLERAQSPTLSYLSMRTDRSIEPPPNLDISSIQRLTKQDGSELSTREAHAEMAADVSQFPQRIEDWTTEEVRDWLTKILRVPESVSKKLYDQDVSGGCLVCFDKKDLIDLGLTIGPVVQIIKMVDKLRKNTSTSSRASFFAKKEEQEAKLQEVDVGKYERTQEIDTVKSDSESLMAASWMPLERMDVNTTDTVTPEKRICVPRLFDKKDPSFMYTQNNILPLAVGPSDLIEPVHEYKLLLGNMEEVSEREILYEFCNEAVCFAASCMNSRTNGTIHFGVNGAPENTHGQIVGQKVSSFNDYIIEFEMRLDQHFKENKRIAKACVRPPQFFQVQNIDGTTSGKYVIEVDVIPTYFETQEMLFYTYLSTSPKGQHVGCNTECLFVRQGTRSMNILEDLNQKKMREHVRVITEEVKNWASTRKEMEKNCHTPKPGKQGHKLKQLITHGRATLENSLYVILVTNKCHPSQLEHLHFLKEMKLFAVLEFDPESDKSGTCGFYRKDRIANLHYPRMYNTQENVSNLIAKLNLFKQTSWVFCNGRANEQDEQDMPFSPSDWLKKRAGEVSDMVSILCNPDVLPKDRLLMVFLLHSVETDVSSPIMETFCAIYRNLEGEDNMVCLCKDSTVFSQWKELINSRCKVDITHKCIYELSLNEIDSTIRKLKEPRTQSSCRYLPSIGSSSVLLTKKDEELMTDLNILCENECEDSEIETAESFKDFTTKTEEDFYRGGQVTWWNFYLSERPGCLPFIKRNCFEDLQNLITESSTFSCVIINLFHHPGCGGTTMAMHVLWSLRRKFRCTVLKNNIAHNSDIAVQVLHLLTCGREEQSNYTPVLLLVDNWVDVEDLQRCILNGAREKKRQEGVLVVILNCERTQFPDELSGNSRIDNVFITNKLSPKEKKFFNEKLKDLKDNHEKPETFYAFMIMTNNFSEEYIENLVCNTLKDLDTSSKQGRLISFLAILNTYVNGSCMSLSLCEELVGIRNALWERETLEDKMNPYSTLLIHFSVEEHGTYQAVRFLHQMIASNCLKVLTKKHNLFRGEITTNLLHCDLLYKSCMGKDILVQNIQSMLITRHRKELGNDKDTLFSPLIEDIHNGQGTEQIKQVLIKATDRFDKNATVPQALARHFYLKEKDFKSALLWAKDAQQKKYNSYIADTLGQVHKSSMKHELTQDLTPEMLDRCLESASNAIKAFRDSQDLARKDEQPDPFDQRNRKRQKTYNTSGYVGEMEVTMMIFNVIKYIPFFNESPYQKDRMLQFLSGQLSTKDLHIGSTQFNSEYIAILADHERFLVSLRPRLKESFTFFESYFTYLKPKSIERESLDDKNKRKVSDYFSKYMQIFCAKEEKDTEKASKPHLSVTQEVKDQRRYLEEKRADSFAGLLQCLTEKNRNQMEFILKKWQFIVDNSVRKLLSDRIHYILANIVLHSMKSSSGLLKKYEDLVSLLNEMLQDEGTHSNCTELYYLSMLLMWPNNDNVLKNTTTFKNIGTYVTASKKSFNRRFSHLFPARSAISHFYLGNSHGLKRIISKAKIEQALKPSPKSSKDRLWQTGLIWKETEVKKLLLRVKGKTENGEIHHFCGNVKILVRPVYLGGVRPGCSVEEVSFYIGFSMEGPVAYDLQYVNDP